MSDCDSRLGVCRFLAGLAVMLGVMGMVTSFLYLASASFEDITAGTSGFVAGSVLVGSGLVSMSMLAGSKTEQSTAEPSQTPRQSTIALPSQVPAQSWLALPPSHTPQSSSAAESLLVDIKHRIEQAGY